ncbi:MAG: Ger(x)C family spore germination protein [Thermotaleaceae bacterium]
MRVKKGVFLLASSLFLLTGCWDKVEINERAFVIGIGIDKFEAGPRANRESPLGEYTSAEDQARNRYSVTYSFPNTGLLAGKGEGDPAFTFTAAGKNFYDIEKLIATRIKQTLFFGHTKVMVVGEDFARDEDLMRELLDAIERNPLLGRKVSLIITPGKAKEVLESKPPLDPRPGWYMSELIRQKQWTSRIPDADLGYILRSLHESQSAITPRVIATEEDIKIAGAAILKDYHLVGWLGEMEARAVMFMQDKLRTTEISPQVGEKEIPVELSDAHTKMRVFERDGEMVVSFDIEAEGIIEQHRFEVRGETFDAAYIRRVEQTAARDIHKQIEETYEKLQKDYEVDIVQANEYLRKFEPDLWRKVKSQWSEIYPHTNLELSVKVKVRRMGVVK